MCNTPCSVRNAPAQGGTYVPVFTSHIHTETRQSQTVTAGAVSPTPAKAGKPPAKPLFLSTAFTRATPNG